MESVCHCCKRVSSNAHNPRLADNPKSLKNDSFQENPLEKYIPFSYIPVASAIKSPKLTGPQRRFLDTGFNKASVVPRFLLANGETKLCITVPENASTNKGNTNDFQGAKVKGESQEPLSFNDVERKFDLPRTSTENDDNG